MAEQALTPQQIALSSNFQREFLRQQQQMRQMQQMQQMQQQQIQQQQIQQQQQQMQQQQMQQQQQQLQQQQQVKMQVQQQSRQQQFHAGNGNQNHVDAALTSDQSIRSQESQLFQLFQNFNQAPANPQPVPSSSSFLDHTNSIFKSNNGGDDQSRGMMDQYRNIFAEMLPDAGSNAGGDRLMLQSKVEPFQRDKDPLPASEELDLWKVFDDDFGHHKAASLHKVPNLSLNNFAFPPQNHQQLGQDPTPPLHQSSLNANANPATDDATDESHIIWQTTPIVQDSPAADQDDFNCDFNAGPFILPSTMIPPSVLAFSSSGESKKREANKNLLSQKRKRLKQIQPSVTPQAFFEQLVVQRGHTYRRIASDDAEYDAVPSALQLASFGTKLVKAVHTGDTELLSQLLECGLSPNPCNQFRDSILDLVTKRANESIFMCLLEHNCDLQVVDGFGRTPLHHACWASTFSPQIVDNILQRDPIQLCIEDKHGQTPLEYVRSELAGEWIVFLEQNINKYFDPVPVLRSPKERRPDGTLVDPPNSIGVSLAALVSAGSISPAQISQMDEETRCTYKAKA